MKEGENEEEKRRGNPAAGTANFDGQILIEGSGKETVISPQELDKVLREKMTILEAHWSVIGPIIAEIKSIKERNNASMKKKEDNPVSYSSRKCNSHDKNELNKDTILEFLENILSFTNYCDAVKNTNKDVSNLRSNPISCGTSQTRSESSDKNNNCDIKEYINSWDCLSLSDKWKCLSVIDFRCSDESKKQSSSKLTNFRIPETENNSKQCKTTFKSTDSVFLPTNSNMHDIEYINRQQNNTVDIDKTLFDLSIKNTFDKQHGNLGNVQCISDKLYCMSTSSDAESNQVESNKAEIDFFKIERVFEKMLFHLKLDVEEDSNQSEVVEVDKDVDDEVSSIEQKIRQISRLNILQEINTCKRDAEESLKLFRRIGETSRNAPSYKLASLQHLLLSNLIANVEVVCKYASDLDDNCT